MRTSERIAVAAVVLMITPAFLALPVLGVWGAIHVWPGLTSTQHLWFWLSLATLGFAAPYVVRRHLDAVWYGRTKELSWFEKALILAPVGVGAWALTGSWAAAFAVLYPKLLLSFVTILNALKGRTEPVAVRSLMEPEDIELSPVSRLVSWVKSRQQARARQTITREMRRARSRRDRGG